MAFYNKNIRDESLKATRALPATDEAVTSADIDLAGPLTAAHGLVEVLVSIPELTATHLPSADTLDIVLQHGAAVAPTTLLHTFATITGTGSTIAAQELRCALPSSTLRYLNAKMTAAGGVGDMSAVTATIEILT